ncbi:MAG TPA: AraC family transcriptional regulator [Spirochaetia bacterium]|nr:AraC family transcriptional regulator [Spirochaetia bacterium]
MQNQHDRGRRDGDFFLSTPTEVENELPFQLFGAGCDFYQYAIERPFGFPVYQWIQTIRGTGVLATQGTELPVGANEGMLLFPDEAHRYHSVDEPWYVHWITFSGHHIENMLHYIGMDRTGVYRVSEPPMIESLIRKALVTLQSDYPLRGIDGSGVVYQLLLDFLKYYQREGTESHDRRMMRLKPALDLIEAEMHRPISLDDLAGSVGVTPQYFCEIFKGVTSHRPTEYVNQRRVDRARQLLMLEPRTRISDIARRVGFESDSYFATVFRRFEGVSPTQYRDMNANKA